MKVLFGTNAEFWMVRRLETLYIGLKENGVVFVEFFSVKKSFLKRFFEPFITEDFDFVLVHGFFPFLLAWIMKPIHRRKIIYDVFISLYNTEVEDRKRVKKGSLKARVLFFLDKFTCNHADVAFLDTKTHVKYFNKKFNIKKKLKVVYVGANEKLWKIKNIDIIKNKKFNVVFWGAFSPLHGADIIVKSAKLLEKNKDIQFHMLGFSKEKMFGQCNKEVEELVENSKNITLKYGITLKTNLVDYANSADVCLGIFGNSIKSNMVIPHKAFESLALNKPLITKNTDAAREIFENNKHCILVKDEKELAEAVLKLKKNKEFREKIANKGYDLYKENYSTTNIGKQLLKIIRGLK